MSPLFSNVGLGFACRPGIDGLHLYYNRRATSLGPGWLTLPGELQSSRAGVLGVAQRLTAGTVDIAFFARDEPIYQPAKWWRGPVWLPVAYLMLEVLSAHGFHDEREEASRRLLAMVAADGNLRELFNSQTGEGLGTLQQGWTAAITLRLVDELNAC